MTREQFFCSFLSIVYIFLWSGANGEAWDSRNDPHLFGKYLLKYDELPTSGGLSKAPWSDTYWPSYQSGIAHRWNSDNPSDFKYTPYTKDQLRTLPATTISQLSPAEKFDIFNGRYDYPTVHSEWTRTKPDDERWEGLCHGWAPSSIFYDQPKPVTLINSDGIQISFGSSDVKGLLTYFVAEYDQSSEETGFIGDRCKYDIEQFPKYENNSACKDMNAGSFHVVIANQLGKMNEGFVADRDRSIQVWNQPIYQFKSSQSHTDNVVEIDMKMIYVKETVPQWEAHEPYLVTEEYSYNLELDGSGMVVGGSHNTWARTDFAWKTKIGDFNNYFGSLKKIYDASVGNHAALGPVPKFFKPYPIHSTFSSPSGKFSTGASPYSSNYKSSWSIQTASSSIVEIHFHKFDTERYRDKVKIYEGSRGEGALVAVLHGNEIPNDISIKGGAFITFTTDSTSNARGFIATYLIR